MLCDLVALARNRACGTLLFAVACWPQLLVHDWASHLLPRPRRGFCLPQTDSDCFAGLSIGEHVYSRETGNALQNPKCLHLGSPSNLVIDPTRRAKKVPIRANMTVTSACFTHAMTPSTGRAAASVRTLYPISTPLLRGRGWNRRQVPQLCEDCHVVPRYP